MSFLKTETALGSDVVQTLFVSVHAAHGGGARYTVRHLTIKPPTTAAELVRRYNVDERAFQGADLQDVELHNANLVDACLMDANLRRANLRRANLQEADLTRANLQSACLVDACLVDANLVDACLVDANLRRANILGANILGANLQGANLQGVSLQRAGLQGADLQGANLQGANLQGADLQGANLQGANLQGALLDHIILGNTHLVGFDLTPFCEAHFTTRHYSPSFVDPSTVLRSVHAPNLKYFLARAGVPEVFVEYMVDSARSLSQDVFKMLRSTFISYGQPDEAFARKLYEALHRNGVVTFFFPEHAVPGEKLHRMMRTKVNEYDRILLVCSAAALVRNGVLNEIEETLTREARDGGAAYLIPITLDDYVFTGWTPPNADTAQAVRARVVADFRGADTDPAKFQSALLKLIGALKK